MWRCWFQIWKIFCYPVLSANNYWPIRYRPIIGQFASVTNLRSYHWDFTIVTIWLLLNEDASWNKQSVIGRLFGANIGRPSIIGAPLHVMFNIVSNRWESKCYLTKYGTVKHIHMYQKSIRSLAWCWIIKQWQKCNKLYNTMKPLLLTA